MIDGRLSICYLRSGESRFSPFFIITARILLPPSYTNLTYKDAIEKCLQHCIGNPAAGKADALILVRIASCRQQPQTGTD
jgi:hypothetical protein